MLALGCVGALAVCAALAYRFRDELLVQITARIIIRLLTGLDSDLEAWRPFIERLGEEVGPTLATVNLGKLVPVFGPLLTLATPPRALSKGYRTGDYLAVEYEYGRGTYTALLSYAEGPYVRRATAVMSDDEARDVTERVKSYAGPCADFHGQPVRPRDVVRGCRALSVLFSDGVEVQAQRGDVIVLDARARGRGAS
jgi:hypothetical protein